MKYETTFLLNDLKQRVEEVIKGLEQLQNAGMAALNQRAESSSWSALECIEHLNLYGDFYLPEILRAISNSKYPAKKDFKSGLLGNYFAQSMLPKEKLNKMKTFKDKNPLGSVLHLSHLERCLKQQREYLSLLNQAAAVDLTKTKTAISISKQIRLRLGDTLRFVIYHEQRHLLQAFRAAGLQLESA